MEEFIVVGRGSIISLVIEYQFWFPISFLIIETKICYTKWWYNPIILYATLQIYTVLAELEQKVWGVKA